MNGALFQFCFNSSSSSLCIVLVVTASSWSRLTLWVDRLMAERSALNRRGTSLLFDAKITARSGDDRWQIGLQTHPFPAAASRVSLQNPPGPCHLLISLCVRPLEGRYNVGRRGHLCELCEACDVKHVFSIDCQHWMSLYLSGDFSSLAVSSYVRGIYRLTFQLWWLGNFWVLHPKVF